LDKQSILVVNIRYLREGIPDGLGIDGLGMPKAPGGGAKDGAAGRALGEGIPPGGGAKEGIAMPPPGINDGFGIDGLGIIANYTKSYTEDYEVEPRRKNARKKVLLYS
jgi:hypothetical protein